MKKQAHLIISGMVQGVGYRVWTRHTAKKLGITGWVTNTPDGKVEVVAQGDAAALDELIKGCHHGPPIARVDGVDVSWDEADQSYESFDIVR